MSQEIDDAGVGVNDQVQFSFHPNPASTQIKVLIQSLFTTYLEQLFKQRIKVFFRLKI
jgi:hypothetical protein